MMTYNKILILFDKRVDIMDNVDIYVNILEPMFPTGPLVSKRLNALECYKPTEQLVDSPKLANQVVVKLDGQLNNAVGNIEVTYQSGIYSNGLAVEPFVTWFEPSEMPEIIKPIVGNGIAIKDSVSNMLGYWRPVVHSELKAQNTGADTIVLYVPAVFDICDKETLLNSLTITDSRGCAVIVKDVYHNGCNLYLCCEPFNNYTGEFRIIYDDTLQGLKVRNGDKLGNFAMHFTPTDLHSTTHSTPELLHIINMEVQ